MSNCFLSIKDINCYVIKANTLIHSRFNAILNVKDSIDSSFREASILGALIVFRYLYA